MSWLKVAGITIYALPFYGFCFIIVGGASRFIKAKIELGRSAQNLLSWLVAGSICFLAVAPPGGLDGTWSLLFPFTSVFTRFFLMLLSGLLLWLIFNFQESTLVHFLELRFLQFAGKISYAFYVVHLSMIAVAEKVLMAYAPTYQTPSMTFLLSFVFTTVLSILSYYLMEQPLRRWKRSLWGIRPGCSDLQLQKAAV
jgi:peptidoglycan/LPS O-acetylase OafA/YrhL